MRGQHALGHLARKSLGSLFTGGDWGELLAKAESVSNMMIDMLEASNKLRPTRSR